MIYSGEAAIEYLANQAIIEDTAESSHWRKYHSQFEYTGKGFQGLQGFGCNTKPYGGVRKLIHQFFQKRYRRMGKGFPDFDKIDTTAREITTKQQRGYDLDVLRQSLTLALLKKNRDKLSSNGLMTCVIGDGFASMTSLMLRNKFSSKVVLVNLTKTLLVDLWYLKLWLGDDVFKSNVKLATDISDAEKLLEEGEVSDEEFGTVIAVEAKNHETIKGLPIDLVVNIASMQEMDPSTINDYFKDLRVISASRKLMFYCCNREEKQLPDGTVTKLSEYPWLDNDKVLIDELCPWHQDYYSHQPPFFHVYDGPIRHRLVEMSC